MNSLISECHVLQVALAPIGDRYNTNPASDIFNMAQLDRGAFWLEEGAGGTGTVKIQIEACSDVSGTGNTAIAFKYRLRTAPGAWGAITAGASTGYTTVAGANKGVIVEFQAADLPAGKPFIRCQLTEVANDPCDAALYFIGAGPSYADAGSLNPTV